MTTQEQRLAKEFLDHAVEFVDACERLRAQKPFLFHPTFYCVLHAIELALKSHLAAAGYSKSRLASRTLGHNLGVLLTAALGCSSVLHAQLHPRDQRAIKVGAKSYSRKCFEYPESFVTTAPIGHWIRIADRLIRYANQKITPKA